MADDRTYKNVKANPFGGVMPVWPPVGIGNVGALHGESLGLPSLQPNPLHPGMPQGLMGSSNIKQDWELFPKQ